MNLSSFLSADRVVLGLKDGSQQEILEQLLQPLIKHNILSDPDVFMADLIRREQEITTVTDNGVAIPHARSSAVRKLGLVVGLSPEVPLHFSPDQEVGSQLFFCIAVPAYAPTAHMPLLQILAKFAREPQRVKKILTSKTPSAASRYLINYKG